MYIALTYVYTALMSITTVKAWHCDRCWYEWLKVSGSNPKQCPNRKCRKRDWNMELEPSGAGDITVDKVVSAFARTVNKPEQVRTVIKSLDPTYAKPEPVKGYYQPSRKK